MTIEERNTARAIQDIAKEMKKTPKIDWEQRRFEIAKDVLAAITTVADLEKNDKKRMAVFAIACTDALIEELKKGKE